MDQSANLFSYCIGGLALISTLVSITIFTRGYLPNAQMKILTELLDETKAIYEKAEADQLLPDEQFRRAVRKKLVNFDSATSTLRVKAYESMSLHQEYLAAIRGLSQKIAQLSLRVKKFRSFLLSASEEGRRLKERQRSVGRNSGQFIAEPDQHSPDTSLPNTTIKTGAHAPSADPLENIQAMAESSLSDGTYTIQNPNPSVNINSNEMEPTPPQLAALIGQLDSLDDPPASSSSHPWSFWGRDSEQTVPSPNALLAAREHRHPSFSGSTLSSSSTLLSDKPRPRSSLVRWIDVRNPLSEAQSDMDQPSSMEQTSSSLSSWGLLGWWKSRSLLHQGSSPVASPDVASLPV